MSQENKSKTLDIVAESFCIAFEPTDIEAFKAGWDEALKSAPEVQALVEALEMIAAGKFTTTPPFETAREALAKFRAAVEGK